MKGLSDQRKLYGLSAALMILTVAMCCVWGLWGRGSDGTRSPEASPTPIVAPTVAEAGAANADMVSTVAYYQDNYGYLVPVMKTITNRPGIAKATLEMMVQNPANDMEAARLGLRTVIPQGTTFDLDIADGAARIDLSAEANTFSDAAGERNMVSAIVQTLTEFPTVDTVRFLIAGQERDTLKNGTPIKGDFTREAINLESRDDGLNPDDADADTVTLYFGGETASLIIPVTRMVYGQADLTTAVLELVKGPAANSPLDSALPADLGLISVSQDGGKVVVNFTKEFLSLFESSDGGRQALRALALTCAQFDGVESVEIQVEGEPYDVGGEALAIPSFVNVESALVEETLQAQAEALVDAE